VDIGFAKLSSSSLNGDRVFKIQEYSVLLSLVLIVRNVRCKIISLSVIVDFRPLLIFAGRPLWFSGHSSCYSSRGTRSIPGATRFSEE
jgi:hypothetical protein